MMSAIIFCEAGNQSKAGKTAVGIVVMNRKNPVLFQTRFRVFSNSADSLLRFVPVNGRRK